MQYSIRIDSVHATCRSANGSICPKKKILRYHEENLCMAVIKEKADVDGEMHEEFEPMSNFLFSPVAKVTGAKSSYLFKISLFPHGESWTTTSSANVSHDEFVAALFGGRLSCVALPDRLFKKAMSSKIREFLTLPNIRTLMAFECPGFIDGRWI